MIGIPLRELGLKIPILGKEEENLISVYKFLYLPL